MTKKTTPATAPAASKNRPVHSVKIGPVSGSVFLNTTDRGETFPSVIISRTYKSGTEFKKSNSYGAKHLENLAGVIIAIQTWLQANYPQAAN